MQAGVKDLLRSLSLSLEIQQAEESEPGIFLRQAESQFLSPGRIIQESPFSAEGEMTESQAFSFQVSWLISFLCWLLSIGKQCTSPLSSEKLNSTVVLANMHSGGSLLL